MDMHVQVENILENHGKNDNTNTTQKTKDWVKLSVMKFEITMIFYKLFIESIDSNVLDESFFR